MTLTGHCKLDFTRWYLDTNQNYDTMIIFDGGKLNAFDKLSADMKFGVYRRFFDTVNLELVDFKWRDKYTASLYLGDNRKIGTQIGKDKGYSDRDGAQNFIVEAARDYYNDNYQNIFKPLIDNVWININKK